MDLLQAVLLGIVEGLTEFLPVSSTAHLMLTASLLGKKPDEFLKTFEIAIQPGAILAVLTLYWRKLLVEWETAKRVAVAFVPTAVLGVLCYKTIKSVLLESHYVALAALALGGMFLILFEKLHREKPQANADLAKVSLLHCVIIGCCQAFAFVPGVSRSAATILGGLILGWERRAAVEFSFLLAVPTMLAATAYDLYRSTSHNTPQMQPAQAIMQGVGAISPAPAGGPLASAAQAAVAVNLADSERLLLTNQAVFSTANFLYLGIGFFVSFVVALISIRFLLRFIRSYTFVSFGVYRIVFAGLVFLWMIFSGHIIISDS